MGSARTLVTPSPKSLPAASPKSGVKVPNPMSKRRLLDALEAECQLLELLMLKKRKMMANKAVEAARAARLAEHACGNLTALNQQPMDAEGSLRVHRIHTSIHIYLNITVHIIIGLKLGNM